MRERLAQLSLRLGPPLGLGLVLGLIGPFGTYDLLPAAARLAYWLAVVSMNWLLADAVLRRVEALAGDRLPAPRLTVPVAGACLAAVPATGVVALANGLSGIGWPGNIAVLFGQVLLLLTAIALPVYNLESMEAQNAARPDPATPEGVSSPHPSSGEKAPQPGVDGLSLFQARLPGPLGGRILCLEMQDHYLVVHHSGGSEMILCRMEDAARELDGLGRRVHRSWWVAADAVIGVEREGQRTLLRLTDDRRVPVGRSFRPDLKAAGWL
ncbi:LytTR family transcriptional regulator [Lutimaribacter sp. EGI FJ00015]|uniref:LytTR family transcriptional regulator n=1 Tax=Lutimaribacter degradans TaxID=2945989 RepID=A0ACC5ZZV5_9RHOB|nr:LytTR family DNA-binding domain-containing protein [Lutimaribacter sp. EGI FJ00013]MCM2563626.1 LytTR family transcriptional regulator [Lutimaribacter sp. EGI FJ00013]MCO0614838.1 LytTR family transcriptional regulator [Lutimaribacter sp. EGI FJ00015]MCO0637478.1 LytTR family transcriptional regulator [Lutimaribacter sp. EGI FJ00014]